MDELIKQAKEKFAEVAKPNWRLNERILENSIAKFKVLKEQGFIDNDDQIIRFGLIMATEFE